MSQQHIGTDLQLGFIGAGNMARSLIGGLLKKGYSADQIAVSDPSPECQDLARSLDVKVLSDNEDLVAQSNVVVLAVKPQVMSDVIATLTTSLHDHKPLVVSIAAGINCKSLEGWSKTELPIVRCMPNTPALVQEGATAMFANRFVSSEQKTSAQAILEAVGLALWVNSEAELDAVTALSGSGPAYFFLLMEAMQNAGESLGLNAETAGLLVQQTALGAAKMAFDESVSPAELRRRVTSPKGTTEAAINSFQANKFEEIVNEALQAAEQRSNQLAQELG